MLTYYWQRYREMNFGNRAGSTCKPVHLEKQDGERRGEVRNSITFLEVIPTIEKSLSSICVWWIYGNSTQHRYILKRCNSNSKKGFPVGISKRGMWYDSSQGLKKYFRMQKRSCLACESFSWIPKLSNKSTHKKSLNSIIKEDTTYVITFLTCM